MLNIDRPTNVNLLFEYYQSAKNDPELQKGEVGLLILVAHPLTTMMAQNLDASGRYLLQVS